MLPLRCFLAYGSIASSLGSQGQSSYAAANAQLGSITQAYGSQGMPSMLLSWGAWGSIGMAASFEGALNAAGVRLMKPDGALQVLSVVLQAAVDRTFAQVERSLIIANVDWPQLLRMIKEKNEFMELFYREFLALEIDLPDGKEQEKRNDEHAVLDDDDHGRCSCDEQEEDSIAHSVDTNGVVLDVLHHVLGKHVGADEPLMMSGLDSIGMVEVQTKLEKALGIKLPSTLVFDYPTRDALEKYINEVVAEEQQRVQESKRQQVQKWNSIVVVKESMAPQEAAPRNTVVAIQSNRNPRAPLLTKEGYFTVPSLRRLQVMSDDQLESLPRFVIGRIGVGEIAFLYPVDVRNANLDEIVRIERGRISLYAGAKMPDIGRGLNQPALMTLKKIFPSKRMVKIQKSMAFRGLLLQACVRMGATFVHYDADEGVWVLKVDGFYASF